jgi:hypothetical protein
MENLSFLRGLRLRNQDLFYLEQWIAFLLGLLCLGVSAWAGFSGFGEPASVHHSWFSENAFNRMKYSLAMAVALLGTALVRFAFYKLCRTKGAAPVRGQRRLAKKDPKDDAGAGSTLLESATHKRRG